MMEQYDMMDVVSVSHISSLLGGQVFVYLVLFGKTQCCKPYSGVNKQCSLSS